MKQNEYGLVKELMKNAAAEQICVLNSNQLDDLVGIMKEHVPSLLASPAAINLFAHTAASEELSLGGNSEVRFDGEEFRSQVIRFIAGADRHTIYKRPAAGEAYERLFVHAKLAFISYEDYHRPIARGEQRHLSVDASTILSDVGLTTRDGRLNKVLYNYLKPAMPSLFAHYYNPKDYGNDPNNLREYMLRKVMDNHKIDIKGVTSY